MRYEGDIYRPPSEAYSYLLQLTVGCTHNKCTFCSMYKNKRFHIRQLPDIFEDLEMARKRYSRVSRIFLCDGDALCLLQDKLMAVLERIALLFPECERVSSYGRASDVLRKSPEDLRRLREAGLTMVYLGAESGSPKILEAVNKGVSAEELISGVRRLEDNGIAASVTFISGLGGRKAYEEHAILSGRMLSEMNPSYASLLTLMVEPAAPLYEEIKEGRFELLTPEEVLLETKLFLENTELKGPCVFRSNHASNYLSLKGNLPEDRASMISELDYALSHPELLKPEAFRLL